VTSGGSHLSKVWLRENRVTLMAGTRNWTIRAMSPLVVTADEVDEAVQAFASAVSATS